MDEREAAEALEAMQGTRRQMASRAKWSLGRHAAFGLLMGALVASHALPGLWPIAGLAACMAGTALIVARDRRRDGFFVNGYRAGRTRGLTIGLVLAAVAALALAIFLRNHFGLVWAPVAIGAGLAVLGTAASMAWERVYRRELEGADHD